MTNKPGNRPPLKLQPAPLPAEISPQVHRSWWLGVIPALAAIVLLIFWATGQFEELFGIVPQGTWHGETLLETAPGTSEIPDKSGKRISWELVIKEIAGEMWIKVSRDGEEVLSGAVDIDENAITYNGTRGIFAGIYRTDNIRFRYNPFAHRYLDAVLRLGPGDAYSVEFKRQ